jgi:syntaxin 1B/2/3
MTSSSQSPPLQGGTTAIVEAKNLQKNTRKWIMFGVVIALLIVLVIVLAIILPKYV